MGLHPKNKLVHGPKRTAPARFVDVRTGLPVTPSPKVKKALQAARRKAK